MNFSSLPYALQARPSHPPWLDHTINIRWSVQAMKLLIMQSSPVSRYLLPLTSKYRVTFRNNLVLCGEKLLAPRPTPKLQDLPWSAVRDVIHSYLPCLQVVSSIHNTRTLRVVVTGTHMTDNSIWKCTCDAVKLLSRFFLCVTYAYCFYWTLLKSKKHNSPLFVKSRTESKKTIQTGSHDTPHFVLDIRDTF
jgi:hypothetical protein